MRSMVEGPHRPPTIGKKDERGKGEGFEYAVPASPPACGRRLLRSRCAVANGQVLAAPGSQQPNRGFGDLHPPELGSHARPLP
jgi:hypothetical protein